MYSDLQLSVFFFFRTGIDIDPSLLEAIRKYPLQDNAIFKEEFYQYAHRPDSHKNIAVLLKELYYYPPWQTRRLNGFCQSFEMIPRELWSDIITYLSDDRTTLLELLLIQGIRSGFVMPLPYLPNTLDALELIKLIPTIEGRFHNSYWIKRYT